MVKTEKKLTNIKLTESDTDGIWLHFEAIGLKAGLSLQVLSARQAGGVAAATIQNWAREQLDKQEVAHRRFCLHPDEDTLKDQFHTVHSWDCIKGIRPSLPVEGGY